MGCSAESSKLGFESEFHDHACLFIFPFIHCLTARYSFNKSLSSFKVPKHGGAGIKYINKQIVVSSQDTVVT